MKRSFLAVLVAASSLSTGCSGPAASSVASVDVARISSNWPKFINYQNQLTADTAALERKNLSPREKEHQEDLLRQQYAAMQKEVTDDVRRAAEQVAAERRFKLVVTREYTGYAGTDITPDVEKLLKITESSPIPTP